MQILLNYKAIVNLTDHDNRTPLHYASWFNHKDCCDLLIKNGAVVDFQDQDGRTPLHFAVMHNHNEVAQLLLTSNANYKLKTNGGKTAESIAMANNNNEIIDLLQKLESKVMSDNVVSTNNDKTEKTEIKSASHQSLPNNTNTNTNVSNNSTDEDDDLRSRKEIITEHQKIKQIIAKLVELKDSQFNECNAIREQLDNHVMLINVFTQNQQDIVQQINRLSELVQQIVVTLNLGVQLEQSHSSGMIGKTNRQPISQTTSNLVPSSTPNSVNLPLAESRSFEGQNPKISSVIDPLNSFDNNGNIRLSAGNITVNDQGSYSQPTTTSQSEINEDKDMYININFTKQQLKKQQAAQPTPTPCAQQPQQLSAITSSNGVPLCAYCKKNAATFRCKVCHAPFCNTCLPYIKQKCCPFCQKPQTQGSQANP